MKVTLSLPRETVAKLHQHAAKSKVPMSRTVDLALIAFFALQTKSTKRKSSN